MQVYELIACVQRANENSGNVGNVVSIVQFLTNKYIYIFIFIFIYIVNKPLSAAGISEDNAQG